MKGQQSQIGRMVLAAAVLLLIWAMASDTLLACPLCKEAIGEQSSDGLGKGISYTVMGMVSMPFLLVGTVAGIVIRAYMKRSSAVDADTPQS